MYRSFFAFGLVVLIAGCSSTGFSLSPPRNLLTEQTESVVQRAPRGIELPRELNETVLTAHFLQPGDVVLIEPVSLESAVRFPADQKVLADGTIDLGGYGRVIVAGLTLESAELLIESTVKNRDEEATQVNVRLLEQVQRYYVLGEVASPGSYPFVGNEKVLDGILAAGGLTSQADQCRVILARPTPPPSCRVALPICYREITQLGDTTTNYQLQPGDRIYVASRRLCDDLKFWKSNQTCDRCCSCQYPCPDPRVADFRSPISSVLPAPPAVPSLPEERQGQSTDGQIGEPGMVEDSMNDALPGPAIKRISPPSNLPAVQNAPAIETPRGELQFDAPVPSLDKAR